MNDVSDDNVDMIEKTIRKHGQLLTWMNTKKALDLINSCNTGYWNGSKATWLKVFVIWELPKDVKQILYIDSDTKYGSLENEYTDLNKRYKQDIRKSKTKLIGVGVGGIISGIIVGVLLI